MKIATGPAWVAGHLSGVIHWSLNSTPFPAFTRAVLPGWRLVASSHAPCRSAAGRLDRARPNMAGRDGLW